MQTNIQTDKHEKCYDWGNVYKHPRNMSIQIQKGVSSRAEDIPKFVGFHQGLMPTTRLTDMQKIRIILNQCTNISGMSPKNFRKISHPVLEISLYLYNFSEELSQLTD